MPHLNFLVPKDLWLADEILQNDPYDHPQLVHRNDLPRYKLPSRITRLAILLGIKQDRRSLIDRVVAEAYAFLVDNYVPGDEIIIMAYAPSDHDNEAAMTATENLTRYLYGELHASNPSQMHSSDGYHELGVKIPIQ
ncbi:hypothetical protein B0J17DRAFT_721650 [Rhizoctonia solani]|nr:hypothetical protein B0J17DRAFT_721650 [Rhizoctonia solani]